MECGQCIRAVEASCTLGSLASAAGHTLPANSLLEGAYVLPVVLAFPVYMIVAWSVGLDLAENRDLDRVSAGMVALDPRLGCAVELSDESAVSVELSDEPAVLDELWALGEGGKLPLLSYHLDPHTRRDSRRRTRRG